MQENVFIHVEFIVLKMISVCTIHVPKQIWTKLVNMSSIV